MKRFTLTLLMMLTAVTGAFAAEPHSGVQLGRTRLFIEGGAQNVSFDVANWNRAPILVSTWVEDLKDQPTDAFMTTPSLMQIMPKRTASIRIEQMSAMPQDRETVWWLTVRSVPAVKQADSSRAVFGLTQKIKLHYRPKGLKGDTASAAKKLTWTMAPDGLHVKNSGALSLSLLAVTADDVTVNVNNLSLPFSTTVVPVKAADKNKMTNVLQKGKATFTYIDEFGGEKTVPLRFGS